MKEEDGSSESGSPPGGATTTEHDDSSLAKVEPGPELGSSLARAPSGPELLHFNISETKILRDCIQRFRTTFQRELADIVREQIRDFIPNEVREVIQELDVISSQLGRGSRAANVHAIHGRLLKHVIISQRRELTCAAEEPRHKTAHIEAIRHLEREVRALETMMDSERFLNVATAKLPRLTDFLSIRYAEEALGTTLQLRPREFDEKFHILEAPSLFLPDLAYYRSRSALRSSGVAVAYIDVDDFKAFNTKYSETRIDRDLLPPLMEAIEAHVFAHGHAYRFGGDEYALVLPNTDRDKAIRFLHELQDRLARTEYTGIEEVPSISVGLCHVPVECLLTDGETLERANQAERFAKTSRKGSMATYSGELYRPQDLVLC